MGESDQDSFIWTFPLYMLAGNFTRNADGGPVFHERTFYVAPKADGQKHLAIFTDLDLAETYIEQYDPSLNIEAIPLSPAEMLWIAKRGSNVWAGFLIDPSPEGRPSRAAPFSVLIDAIEAHFGIKDGSQD